MCIGVFDTNSVDVYPLCRTWESRWVVTDERLAQMEPSLLLKSKQRFQRKGRHHRLAGLCDAPTGRPLFPPGDGPCRARRTRSPFPTQRNYIENWRIGSAQALQRVNVRIESGNEADGRCKSACRGSEVTSIVDE